MKEKSTIDLNKIQPGHIFSETSYYKVTEVTPTHILATHLQTGMTVNLSERYVVNMLTSADQYEKVVKVSRENKKDGSPGIRTIFENIGSDVFTVSFKKSPEKISERAYNTALSTKLSDYMNKINSAKASKKSVTKVCEEVLKDALANPILKTLPGQDRILRGYKLENTTNDGMYSVMDTDINEVRTVNVNSITWLIHKGVLYEVH